MRFASVKDDKGNVSMNGLIDQRTLSVFLLSPHSPLSVCANQSCTKQPITDHPQYFHSFYQYQKLTNALLITAYYCSIIKMILKNDQ